LIKPNDYLVTYKTSLDKTAIIITTAVTIMFAVVIGGQYIFITDHGRGGALYTTVACILIYLLAFAFRPVQYIVTGEEVIVVRPLMNVHLARSDFQTVELVEGGKTSGSIRILGVGGLFGYYGSFANFSLGRMTWYATRRDKQVLIYTKDKKKIVLTPNDPEGLVAELHF
jgi:hypothetical protein